LRSNPRSWRRLGMWLPLYPPPHAPRKRKDGVDRRGNARSAGLGRARRRTDATFDWPAAHFGTQSRIRAVAERQHENSPALQRWARTVRFDHSPVRDGRASVVPAGLGILRIGYPALKRWAKFVFASRSGLSPKTWFAPTASHCRGRGYPPRHAPRRRKDGADRK
jgi:hypothetical protein